jgi:hypothetical protein
METLSKVTSFPRKRECNPSGVDPAFAGVTTVIFISLGEPKADDISF